jgi:hypothetical protein
MVQFGYELGGRENRAASAAATVADTSGSTDALARIVSPPRVNAGAGRAPALALPHGMQFGYLHRSVSNERGQPMKRMTTRRDVVIMRGLAASAILAPAVFAGSRARAALPSLPNLPESEAPLLRPQEAQFADFQPRARRPRPASARQAQYRGAKGRMLKCLERLGWRRVPFTRFKTGRRMARPRSRSQGSQASLRQKRPPTAFCRASGPSSSSPIWDQACDPAPDSRAFHAVLDEMVRSDGQRR